MLIDLLANLPCVIVLEIIDLKFGESFAYYARLPPLFRKFLWVHSLPAFATFRLYGLVVHVEASPSAPRDLH